MSLYYWKENRDQIFQRAPIPLHHGLQRFYRSRSGECIVHGKEKEIFERLLNNLTGTILPNPEPRVLLDNRISNLVCSCTPFQKLPEHDNLLEIDQVALQCVNTTPYYYRWDNHTNIPAENKNAIFDAKMAEINTYIMNIMNQEITNNDPHSEPLKLYDARKEICYLVNSCHHKRDSMAAELLHLIVLYLIKPYKGYIMTENLTELSSDGDIRQAIEKLTKEYGVDIDIHSEVEENSLILYVHAACGPDYMAIKSRLKGKDVERQ